jgi:hypothetical protein
MTSSGERLALDFDLGAGDMVCLFFFFVHVDFAKDTSHQSSEMPTDG